MAKLTPYIFSEDARSQAEFYVNALGGEINSVMTHGELPNANEATKDKVMHMCLTAGGITFFMCDYFFAPVDRGGAVNLNLEFATETEARTAFSKLAEGGVVKDPLKKQFWGALFGQIEDKYGINWMITSQSNAAES